MANMTFIWAVVGVVAYIILAPFVGGLLAGFDRKFTAHMQGRKGPPVLQPFFDVSKLLKKEITVVNKGQRFLVVCFLLFIVITGCLFFAGGNFLLVILLVSLFLTLEGDCVVGCSLGKACTAAYCSYIVVLNIDLNRVETGGIVSA